MKMAGTPDGAALEQAIATVEAAGYVAFKVRDLKASNADGVQYAAAVTRSARIVTDVLQALRDQQADALAEPLAEAHRLLEKFERVYLKGEFFVMGRRPIDPNASPPAPEDVPEYLGPKPTHLN